MNIIIINYNGETWYDLKNEHFMVFSSSASKQIIIKYLLDAVTMISATQFSYLESMHNAQLNK